MFKNYLMVAIRSILRRKTYAFINVFGLSLGIAITLLIFSFIKYDLTYDSYHKNSNRIYRAMFAYEEPDASGTGYQEREYQAGISAIFKRTVENKVAGIEKILRYSNEEAILRKNKVLFDETVLMADPEIFEVLSFESKGQIDETLLADKNSAVVTKSFAEKHYPGQELVGQEIELQIYNKYYYFKVTGIIEDLPENSSQVASVIVDFEILYDFVRSRYSDTWGLGFSETYILLEKNVDPDVVADGIMDYLNSCDSFDGLGDCRLEMVLQGLTEKHIDLNNKNNLPSETNPIQFWILVGIGFILILIASINFTTLSIGSSSFRASEVGVRKVMGGNRGQICIQLWIETALITLSSIFIGYTFAELLLPQFSNFVERELVLTLSSDVLALLGTLWLLITGFAGSYPGLVISKFSPVEALRGTIKIGGKRRLRKVLVFVQFTASIFLISATLIMKQQINFVQSKDLGYNKDQVVLFNVGGSEKTAEEYVAMMRNALASDPTVLAVAGSACNFKSEWNSFSWTTPEGTMFNDIAENCVDAEFFDALQLELVEGEGFKANRGKDAIHQVVINETMKKKLGFTNAIGKQLAHNYKDHEIVGVVKDFHFENMKNEIKPLVLTDYFRLLFPGNTSCSTSSGYRIQSMVIRIAPENLVATMKKIEKLWPEILPDYVYNYKFVDEQVEMQYKEDRKWNQIISISSIIAIVIAILGLIGLSTLDVAQRTKEIGIRKVLGASARTIIVLLSKEISRLILVSSAVAWIISWFTMNKWLENFVYRVNVNPILLFMAGCGAFLIAIATVTMLSYKIAHSNPINSLRDE